MGVWDINEVDIEYREPKTERQSGVWGKSVVVRIVYCCAACVKQHKHTSTEKYQNSPTRQ